MTKKKSKENIIRIKKRNRLSILKKPTLKKEKKDLVECNLTEE